MSKFKYLFLALLIGLGCLLGFSLGKATVRSKGKDLTNEKIVMDAIRNSFDNINVRSNNGDISNIRLVCQNGMRYLYSFHYENYGEYEKTDSSNEFAIEMIIDKENGFYFVESLENYYNRYNDKCLNIYE